MLIDTHAHLSDRSLEGRLDDILSRARRRGVEAVIDVGDTIDTSLRCLEHARRHAQVFAAVGIHPHQAEESTEEDARAIAELSGDPRVVAIGETGLDFYREHSSRLSQERLFEKMASIALEADLPLIVHCRGAYERLIGLLKGMRRKGLRGVVHCFSGTPAEAEEIAGMGYLVSVGGSLTYPRNDFLREAVVRLPIESILIETDSPYLPPQRLRGSINEPANVEFVAWEVARLRGLSRERLAAETAASARRLFDRMAACPKPIR